MIEQSLEADYLIVGSGAIGMAFADVILEETDASIVVVDRHHRPGGHWNDAYPFVRLHQPSARYGVNSRHLGSGTKDAAGLNEGYDELASGAEVLGYFEQVMHQQFLPSGRLRYFPMCDYSADKQFTSLVSGDCYRVSVRRKVVDTSFMNVAVPSTHPAQYAVASGVQCVALNELPRVARHPGYVVVGAGKTGMDACLWLLEHGAAPDAIRWIMPRDAWLLDRAHFQSGSDGLETMLRGFGDQMEAAAEAESVEDLLTRLEASGQLLRIDDRVEPTMYRCATVTRAELEQLRRIRNVVRLGRVQRIEREQIVLERGTVPSDPRWLYVNCSAVAFRQQPARPIFADGTITTQCVRACQPVFSGAFIAHVEAACQDDARKNALCGVVPLPERPIDWLRMTAVNMGNQHRWSKSEDLSRWLAESRLDGLTGAIRSVSDTDPEKMALLQRYRKHVRPAAAKLSQLLDGAA